MDPKLAGHADDTPPGTRRPRPATTAGAATAPAAADAPLPSAALLRARERLDARPLPDNPWVRRDGDWLLIRAGYNEAMQRLLRWVPGAGWQATRRAWTVPLTGAELVRSVLPELSRLAEAMDEAPPPPSADRARPDETEAEAAARRGFRDAARLLYGSDWLRETARALQRDEAALGCWLAGEGVAEAPPAQLLHEMQALMRRRAAAILAAAATLPGSCPAP